MREEDQGLNMPGAREVEDPETPETANAATPLPDPDVQAAVTEAAEIPASAPGLGAEQAIGSMSAAPAPADAVQDPEIVVAEVPAPVETGHYHEILPDGSSGAPIPGRPPADGELATLMSLLASVRDLANKILTGVE